MDAIKVRQREDGDRAKEFTYCVIETRNGGDRRAMRRRRTRLRSGKILDSRNAFLVECQIYDRSERGARLRIVADMSIPGRIRLYEDEHGRLIDARVVWRKDGEMGICFASYARSRRITRAQLACLRGRYYAVER